MPVESSVKLFSIRRSTLSIVRGRKKFLSSRFSCFAVDSLYSFAHSRLNKFHIPIGLSRDTDNDLSTVEPVNLLTHYVLCVSNVFQRFEPTSERFASRSNSDSQTFDFFSSLDPFFTGLADKFPTLLAPSDWSVSQTKWNIGNWKSSASTLDRLNWRFWMFKNVLINIVSQYLSCNTKSIIIIECYQSQSNKPKPNCDLWVWSSRQTSNQCLTEVI